MIGAVSSLLILKERNGLERRFMGADQQNISPVRISAGGQVWSDLDIHHIWISKVVLVVKLVWCAHG